MRLASSLARSSHRRCTCSRTCRACIVCRAAPFRLLGQHCPILLPHDLHDANACTGRVPQAGGLPMQAARDKLAGNGRPAGS